MGSNADEKVIEEEVPAYAPSLPMPNVQEMVRRDPLQIPDRYIRDQEDIPVKTDNRHLSSEIPVIDLSLLSDGQEDELKKLDLACEDWGFFQVVNHGVANEVLQGMKDAAKEFFELPLEEKNKYSMLSGEIQGYGRAYVPSEEQKLDWSDALVLRIYPTHYRKLKFWPAQPKEFKEIIEAYSIGVRKVAEELLRFLSLIMGMDKDALIRLQKGTVQSLRANYYPNCCRPDQVLGIGPHSDTTTITILTQDDDLYGLQIRHEGAWVPVKPIPNALVVNVGDVIEIWSNGKYKSIEHRAVTNKDRARLSFASFIIPHEDAEIEPLDHMVNSKQPIKIYKKVRYGDYLRSSLKRKLEGKTHIETAKNKN